MTQLLEKFIAEASKLPEAEQDIIAAWALEEMHAEDRWDESFAGSEDKLASLADEAIAEYRAGKTQPLNVDEL